MLHFAARERRLIWEGRNGLEGRFEIGFEGGFEGGFECKLKRGELEIVVFDSFMDSYGV